MKIIITHHTEYSFDSEVFLEPHYLRFRPRKTPYADIEHFVLTISPKPTGHRVIRDEENNLIDFCWFDGMTQNLVITAETVIQTTSFNPFAFILHPQNYNQFPFEYDESQKVIGDNTRYATRIKGLVGLWWHYTKVIQFQYDTIPNQPYQTITSRLFGRV
ncbi:MAG: transglutaminase N-terminal domain-containing protein [Chitinophagales bacterium]